MLQNDTCFAEWKSIVILHKCVTDPLKNQCKTKNKVKQRIYRVQLYSEKGIKIYKTGVHAEYMKEQSYNGLDAIDMNRKGGAILRFAKSPVLCQKLKHDAEDMVSLDDMFFVWKFWSIQNFA